MVEAHLWLSKSRGRNLHPPRPRRAAFGELIQIDGSHHDWFEGRSPPCVLMVFVDHATSTITSLHFAATESLEAYIHALKNHLITYGIPLSFYGDRCSVLTPRSINEKKDSTQFQKVVKELECKLILAYSPEAKGRVERVNRTLQDRLVKELRLRGISNIEEANVILNEYREEYNQILSKKPSEQINAHLSLEGICLEHVLYSREYRTLDKNYIVQLRNNFYQISNQEEKVHLYKKGKIEIRELLSGERVAFFSGRRVKMTRLNEVESPVLDEKQFLFWNSKKKFIPPKNHPYKKLYYRNKLKEE